MNKKGEREENCGQTLACSLFQAVRPLTVSKIKLGCQRRKVTVNIDPSLLFCTK
jgi:hypothetical protein